MNNAFTAREDEGRYKWLTININNILKGKTTIHYTEDPYEVYDFDMTANSLSYGEIKTIHRDYTKYMNFQIDYNKLHALKQLSQENDRTPYLVCFFDDYNIVWDLTDIDLEERKYTTYCTSTTAENYEKGKREKVEVWLTREEAIWSSPTIRI